MGFADMLVKLGIPMTPSCVEIARKLMEFFKEESDKESGDLAIERGPFPKWKGSKMEKKTEKKTIKECL